jgi:catechol 2,3-dioxygenase-like lactoylglutathione lyase family enzyme
MHWMRGLALFAAGTVLGIFILSPSAAPQEKKEGQRLNHFGLYVKNLDESVNFYKKSMGFRDAFSFHDAQGNPVVYLQINQDTFLELTPASAEHPAGFSHVGIWVDDLNASVARIRQQGVQVDNPRVGGTKAVITNVTDPNGARLELLEYPPESLQKKAIDAWK